MNWTTIRRASTEDIAALDRAAERFCRRHHIDTENIAALTAINYEIWREQEDANGRPLYTLWRRIVIRTLGHPYAEGIVYGCVGYKSK